MDSTLERLAKWTTEGLEPALLALSAGEDDTLALLRELGYDVQAAPAPVMALAQPAGRIVDALDDLLKAAIEFAEAEEDDDEALSALSAAGTQLTIAIVELIVKLDELPPGPAFPTGMTPEELARRLLDWLIVRQLDLRGRKVSSIMRAIGVIDAQLVDPVPSGGPQVPVVRLRPERTIEAITDTGGLTQRLYGWGLPTFDPQLVFERVADIALAYNREFRFTGMNTAVATLIDVDADEAGQVLHVPVLTDPLRLDAVIVGIPGVDLPAEPVRLPGIGLTVELAATAATTFRLTETTSLVLEGAGSLAGGLVLIKRPAENVDLKFNVSGSTVAAEASAKLTLVRAPAPGQDRVRLLNVADTVILDADEARVAVGASISNAGPDVLTELLLKEGLLSVGTGSADGFLAKVLPEGGLKLPVDLHLTWSKSGGLKFEGGTGLTIKSTKHRELGPLMIEGIEVTVTLGTTGLKTIGAVDLGLKIGPLAATVASMGARADIAFTAGNLGPLDLKLGFKPPSGAGFSIKAGPVTGGGFVFFDPDNEQYAGILQLSIQAINITAIGLLTTKLPDPAGAPGATKKGFSLLVIIAVEFPPIQLGYGFALVGIGGLLGIHRTMLIDPLRNGVRDGSVNSILFPQDPIARATQIISQLRSIFPPAEGRFIFGPMIKIGWGPNSIIELSAAVVLELMAPIRLVILGRIQIALPDKKDPVLNLRLDIVGVLDFDKGEVSIDASLVDSRLVVFVITGDMAVRVGWGASKMFAVAAGGFHPKFQPPPGFPALRRLGIALSDSDNPRLRMETYMALTANTIQFGAGVDAYVKVDTFVGSFSAAAKITFDALIQFQPFELIAELSASVDIELNGDPLLHAAFVATLSGPQPWHAIGYAEFNFLGKRRVDFEVTSGTPAKPPISEISPGDVLTEVAKAFASDDAWATLPPADADRVVSVADREPGDAIHVHPLGSLSARQRVIPLGQTIDRFGTSVVRPTAFTLKGFHVGASAAVVPPGSELYDDFAPGQFLSLTDDERVARPAFESMRAGGSVKATRFRIPLLVNGAPDTVSAQSGYEESIVDVEPATGAREATEVKAGAAALPADTLAALVHGGAAAHAETRSNGPREFRGPAIAVGVAGERWVVAGADTLVPVAGAPSESAAEAHERLNDRSPAAPVAAVVPAGEAG